MKKLKNAFLKIKNQKIHFSGPTFDRMILKTNQQISLFMLNTFTTFHQNLSNGSFIALQTDIHTDKLSEKLWP